MVKVGVDVLFALQPSIDMLLSGCLLYGCACVLRTLFGGENLMAYALGGMNKIFKCHQIVENGHKVESRGGEGYHGKTGSVKRAVRLWVLLR